MTTNVLEKALTDLQAQKEAILKETASLHKKRNAIIEKIQPEEDKARELAIEIREIEQPALAEIEMQIQAVIKALK